jgi:DNA invertase Pin-like site-specific DNA recombinase
MIALAPPAPVFLAYLRVSTAEQGRSGLGLEAQRRAVELYTARQPGAGLLATYLEVESGRKGQGQRPELARALQHARQAGATLLVAKLDRLSRNVHFLSGLMEARVAFRCCDLPECDNFTIHLFAALAQKEAELISQRTRAALAERKAQGKRLGTPANLTPEARALGPLARRAQAQGSDAWRRARLLATELRGRGLSLRAIRGVLNEGGYRTTGGALWGVSAVHRLVG